MQFGERFKFLLQKRMIPQVEFANVLGISPARLNNYLGGKAEAPYNLLIKITNALQTTSDYLIGNKNDYISERTEFDYSALFGDTSFNIIPISGNELNNNENDCVFSQRIKSILKQQNITQSKLADSIGVSVSRLNNYLTGNIEAPYDVLINLAQELKTSVDFILGISADYGRSLYPQIYSKYAGTSKKDGTMYITIPIYDSVTYHEIGRFKCKALLRNIYIKPYIIKMSDESMLPYCMKGDMLLVAPRAYISPVINNLNYKRLFVVRLNENDKVAAAVRFCLTKDDVIFLRPSDMSNETIGLNFNNINYNPIGGVVRYILRRIIL